MTHDRTSTCRRLGLAVSLLCLGALAESADAAGPIKVGCSIALTGGLAPNGKPILASFQIWRDDINARGGLLGRPVEIDCYDDQSNPANVPGIYTKLIEVDKVDLLVGPYSTNLVAPALPVVIKHNMTTVGVLALAANAQFHYGKFFNMLPVGPRAITALSEGFFAVAMQQKPKPKTIAIVAADAEFAKNTADGARHNANAAGLRIVYDKSYPPTTTDYTPVIRAVQAANADIVYVASYPPDTVGIVRAAGELDLKAKIFGGNMVGLTTTVFKVQLGPLMNGILNSGDLYLPVPGFDFPGVQDLLRKYQARAAQEHIDPLGYGFAPWGYAALQILGQAVAATASLNQDKIADYIHSHAITTVVGKVQYGKDGEWAAPRVLTVQFQHVAPHDLGQFRGIKKQVILWPPQYKSGDLIYPYTAAKTN